MASRARAISAVLLFGGVAIVFAGLSAALGLSPAGIAASAAAIAGLLYAGGVWFGGGRESAGAPVLFTRGLTIAGGRGHGTPVVELFPPAMREEVEARCRAALDGHASRFTCQGPAGARRMDVAPVRTADGTVAYGLLFDAAESGVASDLLVS